MNRHLLLPQALLVLAACSAANGHEPHATTSEITTAQVAVQSVKSSSPARDEAVRTGDESPASLVIEDAGSEPDAATEPDSGVMQVCTPGEVGACGLELGECHAGTETCNASGDAWDACTANQPSDEYCDGLDNDCDGEVDDDCTCPFELASDEPGYEDSGKCEPMSATYFDGKFYLAQGKYYDTSQKRVYTSDNGSDWTLLTDTPNFGDNGRCEAQALVAHAGKLFLIQGQYWNGGEKRVYTSSDGANWDLLTNTPNFVNNGPCEPMTAVSHDGKLFLIEGAFWNTSQQRVYTSDDGVDWQLLTDQADFPNMNNRDASLTAVSYQGEIWLFMNETGYPEPPRRILTSRDGVHWTQHISGDPFPGVEKCEDMAAYTDGKDIFLAYSKYWDSSRKAIYRRACPAP